MNGLLNPFHRQRECPGDRVPGLLHAVGHQSRPLTPFYGQVDAFLFLSGVITCWPARVLEIGYKDVAETVLHAWAPDTSSLVNDFAQC